MTSRDLPNLSAIAGQSPAGGTSLRDMPEFARFWMVCRKPTRPHHRTEPKARFSTRADAEDTARALAAETGAPFLILETVAVVDPGEANRQRGLL